MNTAKEHEDYYFLPDGRLVMTAKFHLKRGYCCGSGCLHCPFEYENVPEPERSRLLSEKQEREKEKP